MKNDERNILVNLSNDDIAMILTALFYTKWSPEQVKQMRELHSYLFHTATEVK